jgi:uncharacterized protein YjiS (DUF1127 family)
MTRDSVVHGWLAPALARTALTLFRCGRRLADAGRDRLRRRDFERLSDQTLKDIGLSRWGHADRLR